jgi:hypothetical protein
MIKRPEIEITVGNHECKVIFLTAVIPDKAQLRDFIPI